MKDRLLEMIEELLTAINNPVISLVSNNLFRQFLTGLDDAGVEELLQHADNLIFYVRFGEQDFTELTENEPEA